MPKHTTQPYFVMIIFLAALLLASGPARLSADTEPDGSVTNSIAGTNAVAVSDAQTQEIIRDAIEQLRREATLASRHLLEQASLSVDMVAQRLDDTLTTRLGAIERSIEEQHRRDLQAMQDSNRSLLLIAGIFGIVGVLGILAAAAIIVRAMNRLSEVALSLPASQVLGHGPTPTVLDGVNAGQNRLDQASIRFLGAIERLEKRIQELELTARPDHIDVEHNHQERGIETLATKAALGTGSPNSDSGSTPSQHEHEAAPHDAIVADAAAHSSSQAAILIGKGQALMNLGQSEAALQCFDDAIQMDPRNADALVKRGMALEKLQKMEEALASYDRAIATNGSLTLAYLYKGAVCNRLQRFREALECYEKALKTEQKPATP